MKKFFASIVLSLLALVFSMQAQTTVDVTSGGGTINSVGSTLVGTLSTVTATNDPINGLIAGDLGTVHFVTGNVSNLVSGGTVLAGGTVTFNIPGYTISDFSNTATYNLTGGSWTRGHLANGQYYYTLVVMFSNAAGDTGVLEIVTSNSTLQWTGGAPIAQYVSVLNLP